MIQPGDCHAHSSRISASAMSRVTLSIIKMNGTLFTLKQLLPTSNSIMKEKTEGSKTEMKDEKEDEGSIDRRAAGCQQDSNNWGGTVNTKCSFMHQKLQLMCSWATAPLRLWLYWAAPSVKRYMEQANKGCSWVDFEWINHFFQDKLLSVYRTQGLKQFWFWDDASCKSKEEKKTQKAEFDPHRLL